jgi:WD40 repeat protein
MDQLESPPLLIPANQRWGRHLDTDREGIHLLSWYPSQSVMFARVYDFSGQGFPAGFPLPHEIEATFPPPDISLSGGRRGYELGHMELSGNGQRVVAICQSSVKIFGLKENRLLKQFLVPDMRNLARGSRHLSPDGQLLALQTSNGDVQVWDIDAGQVKHHVTDRELKSHYVLAFIEAQSPDRFLLQVSRKTNQQADIYLAHWNPEIAALETLATIDRRLTPIASLGSDYVAFSTNAGSQNQEVAVYRTKDGKCLRRIHGHSQKVAQAALSQDAKWLATMEQSGPVKLWKISDQ